MNKPSTVRGILGHPYAAYGDLPNGNTETALSSKPVDLPSPISRPPTLLSVARAQANNRFGVQVGEVIRRVKNRYPGRNFFITVAFTEELTVSERLIFLNN